MDCPAPVAGWLRDDTPAVLKALGSVPEKAIQCGGSGCLARHPRLKDVTKRASTEAAGAAATLYTDAASKHGWGSAAAGIFTQGKWTRGADCKGNNWEELWISVRMGNASGEK